MVSRFYCFPLCIVFVFHPPEKRCIDGLLYTCDKVQRDVTVEEDRICTLYTKYVLLAVVLSSKRHSFSLLGQFMTALGRADDPS
jgi:hypothetical protein